MTRFTSPTTTVNGVALSTMIEDCSSCSFSKARKIAPNARYPGYSLCSKPAPGVPSRAEVRGTREAPEWEIFTHPSWGQPPAAERRIRTFAQVGCRRGANSIADLQGGEHIGGDVPTQGPGARPWGLPPWCVRSRAQRPWPQGGKCSPQDTAEQH